MSFKKALKYILRQDPDVRWLFLGTESTSNNPTPLRSMG
jgi:hypothetical protein